MQSRLSDNESGRHTDNSNLCRNSFRLPPVQRPEVVGVGRSARVTHSVDDVIFVIGILQRLTGCRRGTERRLLEPGHAGQPDLPVPFRPVLNPRVASRRAGPSDGRNN